MEYEPFSEKVIILLSDEIKAPERRYNKKSPQY